MIKYPKKLNKEITFGITATSSGVVDLIDIKRLDNAYKNLKYMGYQISETSNVRCNKKFVSSNGKIRAQEFMNLWQNKDIDIIAQVRGGEFLMEMLPFLNTEIIINNEPKWIFGYSDSSLLNFYITTNFNIATITGMNIMKFGMKTLDKSLIKELEIFQKDNIVQKNFYKYEEEKKEEVFDQTFSLTKKVIYKSLYKNEKIVVSGRLIGGCVEALTTIIGTKYDKTNEFVNSFEEGILWYLEDYMASPLELYRILWQMKEAGWFQNANGFLIGRTKAIKKVLDFTYFDALHKIFDEFNVPVIYDVDIGHQMPIWTIINGSLGTFTYENGKGNLKIEKK